MADLELLKIEIKEILERRLSTPDCSDCKFHKNDNSYCEGCGMVVSRHGIFFELSDEAAESITKEIIDFI